MDIINNKTQDKIQNYDIEHVEQEKQEYKFIDNVVRTRGLSLFAYNNDTVFKVEIKPKETLELTEDLKAKDISLGFATIDSKNIYFEALNLKTAYKRVEKWKQGKIKELDNLKYGKPGNINIF